ncbi:hypothetical protein BKA56DRAFT_655884 [Ilyonectria sp. MPI-CAGE-AT-0026]|nr:hypothetical protein BKA56DRAFT_655884 [Ilyonectria sp. MPI-CAGE-AT-0026]
MDGNSNRALGSSSTMWTDNVNSSSTLRARLRSPEAPAPTSSPKPPTHHHIYQQFRACFGADLGSSRRDERVPISPPEHDSDAVTQLRESFAQAGTKLHASATAQLIEAHSDIQSRISRFVGESSATLLENEALYSNIAYPLSATLCHSDNFPRASIIDHLTNLKKEFSSTKEELHRLGAEWDECAKAELDAWKLLTGDANQGSTKADEDAAKVAKRFKAEAESIVKEQCQLLGAMEKEFKSKIQAESMRLMQIMIDE